MDCSMPGLPPCPSPTPGAYSNSCPSSRWCHPTISSSVVPFSSCPQSFPASGSFQVSQFFASGGQSIGVSVSASVLPMNIQGWFPLGLTGLISFSSRDSQASSLAPRFKSINSLALSLLYDPTLTSIHDYWKNHGFDYTPLSAEWCLLMSLNTLSRFVTAFLPRSKCLLISWLQSPSAVILEPKKKICLCFHSFPFYCYEVIGPHATILVFLMSSFKSAFHSLLSLSSRGSLVSLHFLPLE